MALRFLSLNINSCMCPIDVLFIDGGGKTDSNCVLISYAQSMYSLSFCLFLFSVSQASLPPSISISVCIVFLYFLVTSLSLFNRLSISISVYPLIVTLLFLLLLFFFFFFVIYKERLLNGVDCQLT